MKDKDADANYLFSALIRYSLRIRLEIDKHLASKNKIKNELLQIFTGLLAL
jgi:hypothetical protein